MNDLICPHSELFALLLFLTFVRSPVVIYMNDIWGDDFSAPKREATMLSDLLLVTVRLSTNSIRTSGEIALTTTDRRLAV